MCEVLRSVAVGTVCLLSIAGCHGQVSSGLPPAQVSSVRAPFFSDAFSAARATKDGQLFVWNGQPGYASANSNGKPASLVIFPKTAHGDVAPAADYPFGAPVLAVATAGRYWTGPFNPNAGGTEPTSVSLYASGGLLLQKVLPTNRKYFIGAAVDANQNLYTVQGETQLRTDGGCASSDDNIYEYSAADSWAKPVRALRISKPLISNCLVPVAIDMSRHFYLGFSTDIHGVGPGDIRQYTLNANGHVRLSRVIALPPPQQSGPVALNYISSLSVDSHNDLFALVNNALVTYKRGSGKPKSVLPGLTIVAFALDAQDNIYAVIQVTPPNLAGRAHYAIEVFAAGSTTPMRTIKGAGAHLTEPTAIFVS
jgi:hypothetical protein